MRDIQADAFWMRRALAEAERGRGFVEPNPLVGAVIVRDGIEVAVGHHARFGDVHAEVAALDRAGAVARGAELFTTLEPCCHYGKQPPCTEAILRAGIARVVIALIDPFPAVAGAGATMLQKAGIEVFTGVEETAARQQNAPYLKRNWTGRPYVTAKWAMTLDGKIATKTGDSQWISGERSRALVHERRGRADAIVVGIGTALADDPLLTARPPGPRRAIRIVLDSAARIPLASRLVTTARESPVWIAVTDRATESRRSGLIAHGCEILTFRGDQRVPIHPLLDELGRRGMTNVLIEGGGQTIGAFFDADEVDEVEAFIAPKIVGGEACSPVQSEGFQKMAAALRLAELKVCELDGDVLVNGRVPKCWRYSDM